MSELDPERLSSRAGPLKGLIEAGRKELPTDAELAAVAAKLGPVLGGGGGGPHGGGGGGSALGAKGSALGSSVSGAAVAKGVAGATLAALAVATVVRLATLPDRGSSEVTARPVDNPAESSQPAIAAPQPNEPPLVLPLASVSAAASALFNTPPKPASSSAPSNATLAEIHLLDDARKAIATDPAKALALCDQHKAHYPTGTFSQERELLAITALQKLGRNDEARARGAKFRAAYPDSPLVRRVDQILSGP